MRRDLDIETYRLVVRSAMFLAIVLVVIGLWLAIPRSGTPSGPTGNGTNGTAPAEGPKVFLIPKRPFEDQTGLRLGLGVASIGLGVAALGSGQYFRIRPVPEAEHLLLLLTRPQCSLCDEARAVIKQVLQEYPFTLQEINIDDQRHLRRRYKNLIPVLLWQGDELGRLRIQPGVLKGQLDAIMTLRNPPTRATQPDRPRERN